ncbi:hypothetical protein BGZ99_001892 [Dissophora globulifera]|uniref:Uncharacterized protein n=1 Tax=Dissophora globulifera TaxID=979702 RepID=A0A9P6UJL3_9FUNG|nr:hypothetical protein BGZ99_001892 [Dissophora globulifera]
MTLKPVAGGNSICQTPMIENPNNNPLFESVRQAMGLNTNITEEVPVRLPPRFSVETVRDQVPSWLLDAICDSHGKTKLAQFFQKVEVAEKKRLAILMAPQEMRSGRTVDFSICAGLEKGMKNRYNHVWPFDKTRVKIEGCEDGEDDYINASFLQPPFGNRSYIATQGPLPSTFEDFWKIVWEQGSRVIVMLTREYEAGRIKCHRYWPTSEDPVMELGPLRVTFSSDRQPDPTNDTIVVRQVYLSNLHCPDEKRRMITQVQYTGWPDFGVPETPLEVLQVVQLANDHNIPASAGPMVVHCSAGCGRTGAFCVIDSILAELKHRPELKLLRERSPSSLSASMSQTASFGKSISNERVLNAMGRYFQPKEESAVSDVVFATVTRFREQRLSMVQCLRQYVFCYEAILWHLAIGAAREQGRTIQIPFKTTGLSTPLKAYPVGTVPSHASLSRGNAPVTTSNEEFSFFG